MRSRNTPLFLTSGPRRAAVLCAAVAACLVLPAMAADPPAGKSPPAPETAAAPSAGMRAAVDPATGKLRPMTAAEAKALDDITRARARASAKAKGSVGGAKGAKTSSALGSESVAPGEVFTTSSGAIGVALDESQEVYSVVTRGADGKLQMQCVTGQDEANKALYNMPQATGNHGEKSDDTK